MNKAVFILTFIGLSSLCLAQDSTVYIQKDATLFSNKYIFFNDGTFKHYYTTDDGQLWYGKGTYFDKGKYRTLYFGEEDESMNQYEGWKIYHATNFQRVLVRKAYGFKSMERNANTGKPGVRLTRNST